MSDRIGRSTRTTSESDIQVEINLDGTGQVDVDTGLPFFDHMLTGFARHGSFDLTVLDISNRPYFVMNGEPENMDWQVIGGHYATVINRHFFETLAYNSRITLHINVHYGRDPHHITEAEYKAVARALREATEADPRVSGVPSTKGAL